MVGRRPRGVLVVDLGVRGGEAGSALRAGARAPRDAGRGMVPGRAAQLRRAHLRPRAGSRAGPDRAFGDPRRRHALLGRAARPGCAGGGGPARARRGTGRPRRRLPAQRPRDGHRLSGHRIARRGLVERRARVRRPLGDRPLRADRAEGPLRRRRLPLRRQGLRPPRDRRGPPARDAHPAADRDAALPGSRPQPRARRPRGPDRRHDVGPAPGLRGRARVRGGALRPPPVGALLLRHDRTAQGDRPRPRRDPGRAAQEGVAASRRRPGGPDVLVHHDRLDDVELPRRHAAHGRDRRALRRQPRPSGHERAVGLRSRRGDDVLRDERVLRGRVHERGHRARAAPTT